MRRRDFIEVAGLGFSGLASGCWDLRSGQPQVLQWADTIEAPPFDETRVNSTCLVCPSRCGVRCRVVDGRLVGIEGNPMHPLSRGGLCPRGVGALQTTYHPDRIRGPLRRAGERGETRWEEISWEDALESLRARLAGLRSGDQSDRLAVVAGHCPGTMEDLWWQFLQAFGSRNFVRDDYADGTDAILRAAHGIDAQPAFDLEEAELVLSFGAPLLEAWWSPVQADAAFGRGRPGAAGRPRLIQIDTRFSRTAGRAREWVGVRPGSLGILALGIAYVLIKEDRIDAEFLRDHVSGYEDRVAADGTTQPGFRSVVLQNYRPEEVSNATGVPLERIVEVAKAFADASPALAVPGTGATLTADGLRAGLAVHSLNILRGNVSRPGGVLVGRRPPLKPVASLVLDDAARAALARPSVTAAPGMAGSSPEALARVLASLDAGTVDTLFLYYSNPLGSGSGGDGFEMVLGRVPFVVSFSPFLDETSRLADLVLPDLLPPERWADSPAPPSFPFAVWSLAQPVVTPRVDGRGTGDVLLELAKRLGGAVAESLPHENMEALLKSRAEGLFAERRGMIFDEAITTRHIEQTEERGWWLPRFGDFEDFWSALVENGGWVDPFYDFSDPANLSGHADGRIHLYPEGLTAPYALEGEDASGDEGFPLRLVPYRVSTLASGTVALQPWLEQRPSVMPETSSEPWVEINPETAHDLGLDHGSSVWVISPRGRYRATALVYPGCARETVNAPYGLRRLDKAAANPLALLVGDPDPQTGLRPWTSTRVRVEPA